VVPTVICPCKYHHTNSITTPRNKQTMTHSHFPFQLATLRWPLQALKATHSIVAATTAAASRHNDDTTVTVTPLLCYMLQQQPGRRALFCFTYIQYTIIFCSL
jgi:hypothetical protein